ncbi:MAG: ATP-dependent helicase [Bacillota bacterium]|jgi:DNA helicase-2/ATP-dependent DNA helicase PcrA
MDPRQFIDHLARDGLQLNESQQTAALHLSGPMQVMAGPGSGKTRVIAARTAAMLHSGIDPRRILVLTFTRAAAREMRARLAALSVVDRARLQQVTMCTFHALAFRLLKQFRGSPRLAPEWQQRRWVEQAILHLGEEVDEDLAEELLRAIGSAKNRRLRLTDLPGSDERLRQVWILYEEAKQATGQMDFEDLLLDVLDLLEQRQDILLALRRRFSHIMVDEFQDTNPLQYQILRLLAAPESNLCVVGDIDQAIYAFRAASPGLLLQFPKDFPGARIIELAENYRSTPPIIELASRLIAHNQDRYQLSVKPTRTGGTQPRLLRPEDEWDEARLLLSMVDKSAKQGAALGDLAVLYRTRAQARPLVSLMVEAKLPFSLRDSGKLGLDHWVVEDCHAWLRLLVDREHLPAFLRVARRQLRLTQAAHRRIEQLCLHEHISPWRAVRRIPVTQVELNRVAALERHWKAASKLPPRPALNYYLQTMGYADYLQWYAEQRGHARDAYTGICDDLLSDMQRFATVASYLQHVASMIEAIEESDQTTGGLNLMTLHGAKGLEFQAVWIIDAISGLLPHHLSKTREAIEEERRLFYVGCTRAQDRLFVIAPRHYRGQQTADSQFLAEAFGAAHQEHPTQSGRAPDLALQATAASFPPPPAVGAAVIHRQLGAGVVTACQKNRTERGEHSVLTVTFAGGQVLKLHWEACCQLGALRKA